MSKICSRHIKQALELARKLTVLADEGEADSKDDSCRVLFGVIRDCAYRVRSHAEKEKEIHVARGQWV